MNKALGSASQIVRNENRIVFDLDDYGNDHSYIKKQKVRRQVVVKGQELCLRARRAGGAAGMDKDEG